MKNLKGIKMLSKKEQQSINGGRKACNFFSQFCPPGQCCSNGLCMTYSFSCFML